MEESRQQLRSGLTQRAFFFQFWDDFFFQFWDDGSAKCIMLEGIFIEKEAVHLDRE